MEYKKQEMEYQMKMQEMDLERMRLQKEGQLRKQRYERKEELKQDLRTIQDKLNSKELSEVERKELSEKLQRVEKQLEIVQMAINSQ